MGEDEFQEGLTGEEFKELWGENLGGDDDLDNDGGLGDDDLGGDGGLDDDGGGGLSDDDLDPEFEEKLNASTQKRLDSFFAEQFQGVENPITGTAITSEKDFKEYQKAVADLERAEKLRGQGIDEGVLNDFVSNHPDVIAARELRKQQEINEAKSFADNEFSKLKGKYPDLEFNNINELFESEKGQALLNTFARTGDLTSSYNAVFIDDIIAKRTGAVKQGVINQTINRGHISQPRGNMQKGKEMTAEEFRSWKAFYPELSKEEIISKWEKTIKLT